jgi:hypothetical protein
MHSLSSLLPFPYYCAHQNHHYPPSPYLSLTSSIPKLFSLSLCLPNPVHSFPFNSRNSTPALTFQPSPTHSLPIPNFSLPSHCPSSLSASNPSFLLTLSFPPDSPIPHTLPSSEVKKKCGFPGFPTLPSFWTSKSRP